jgi:hypothetical protein
MQGQTNIKFRILLKIKRDRLHTLYYEMAFIIKKNRKLFLNHYLHTYYKELDTLLDYVKLMSIQLVKEFSYLVED